MSALKRLVVGLFGLPGGGNESFDGFARRAARAHRALVVRASADANGQVTSAGPVLGAIDALVSRIPERQARDRFLLDPTFIEGLHAAAEDSPSLARWHRHIADPSVARVWKVPRSQRGDHLGNSLAALLFREDPQWCGTIRLQTDLYGRLRFPLCDWSLSCSSKRDGSASVLSQQAVTGRFTATEARFSVEGAVDGPLLVVPRSEWLRMIVADSDRIALRRISVPPGEIAIRIERALPIPGWRVRYDPVAPRDPERADDLTGSLVATILEALAIHSPAIAAEFNSLISAVRGWELPPAYYGTLQSFSDPTLPGVMGINISYSENDEPQASPFCFTWFGHELGHSRSYLIETILHAHGHSLLSKHGESTGTIARYGRPLPFRTLLQIPYTHLYEWWVMMDFLEGRLAGLPWEIQDDPIACADDLVAEIDEAFDVIAREAPLSAIGHVFVDHLRTLCDVARIRWRRLRIGAGLTRQPHHRPAATG